MFFRLAPIFVVLLALLAFSAEARPQRGTLKSRRLTPEERSLTNSERLARGLPPRAPALNRLLPGREPTPAYKRGGSSASPSPSPSGSASVITGRIEVKLNSTFFIGFVNNTASGVGSVDINGVSGTDLIVTATTTATAKGPVSILASNPLFKGPKFIGGGSNTTLSNSTAATVNITNVDQTKAGAPPTPSGASAIWFVDAKTHKITAQWINLDGSAPNTTIAYDSTDNFLFLTANLTAYNAAANVTAEAVEFFLVK